MSSLKDVNQISQDEHDDANNAKRVIMVGVEMPPIEPKIVIPDTFKIETGEKVVEKLVIEKVPVPVVETRVEKIEVPVPIHTKETVIERVEIPVVVTETKVEIIEKPITIIEAKVVEIEKPVVIKEFEKFPELVKYCMIIQTIALTGLLIVKLIK